MALIWAPVRYRLTLSSAESPNHRGEHTPPSGRSSDDDDVVGGGAWASRGVDGLLRSLRTAVRASTCWSSADSWSFHLSSPRWLLLRSFLFKMMGAWGEEEEEVEEVEDEDEDGESDEASPRRPSVMVGSMASLFHLPMPRWLLLRPIRVEDEADGVGDGDEGGEEDDDDVGVSMDEGGVGVCEFRRRPRARPGIFMALLCGGVRGGGCW